jgi:phage FluMu protein Com
MNPETQKQMVSYGEYRCKNCKKLLFKGVLVESEIEVKCKKCSVVNTFVGISEDSLVCFVSPCPHRVMRPSLQKK